MQRPKRDFGAYWHATGIAGQPRSEAGSAAKGSPGRKSDSGVEIPAGPKAVPAADALPTYDSSN
eukprot:2106444-Amphidinium_carterae.2